jgi:hypothetical protein
MILLLLNIIHHVFVANYMLYAIVIFLLFNIATSYGNRGWSSSMNYGHLPTYQMRIF